MALLVQLMQAITLGMIFLCVAAAGVGVNGDDVRDDIAAQLTARDQWAAMRRSPNVEDRSGEPPIAPYEAPPQAVPYDTSNTPLGIDAGAPDLGSSVGPELFASALFAQAAVMNPDDFTMGETAAQDTYDPDQLAKERAIRFRSNASNMSVQPPNLELSHP